MKFYKLANFLCAILLVVSASLVVVGGIYFLNLLTTNPLIILMSMVLLLVALAIAGSYVYVLFSVPSKLLERFDLIKNNVALQKYKSINEYEKAVGEFILDFFTLPGLHVNNISIKIESGEGYSTNKELDELNFSSKNEISILKYNKKSYMFVPIVISNTKIGSLRMEISVLSIFLFKQIINDFENYYLDDMTQIQLFLLESRKKN